MTATDPTAANTRITRLAENRSEDRAALDALMDAVPIGHVGLIADGLPVVIPTFVARDRDTLLAHGSTGSGWMRRLAAGTAASVAVTSWEGIVLARSAFESTLHYRSAVLFGTFTALAGEEKLRALDLMVESIAPGRLAEVRPSTGQELAATLVLALPIERWSLKVSDGWPEDGPEDVAGPAWAGVLPVTTHMGEPVPTPDLRPGIPTSTSAVGLAAGRRARAYLP